MLCFFLNTSSKSDVLGRVRFDLNLEKGSDADNEHSDSWTLLQVCSNFS